jgi:hypothetical protein
MVTVDLKETLYAELHLTGTAPRSGQMNVINILFNYEQAIYSAVN